MSDPIPGEDEFYDAVIVGAGASGAVMALELVRAGKQVLILEAGRGTRDDEEGWRGAVETSLGAMAKVPNSASPPLAQAPQPDVLQYHKLQDKTPGSDEKIPDSAGYFVQHGPQPFSSDYIRAKGGTTMHWQATTLRMLPNDFKTETHYNVGKDWPIDYEDLKEDYEKAEAEIGVSGDASVQNLPGVDAGSFWGKDYHFPMQKIPESYVAQRLADRIGDLKIDLDGQTYPLYVTPTPQGRNGMPDPEHVDPITGKKGYHPTGTQHDPIRGQRCQGNAYCTPICPVQAKYTAHRTLNRAAEFKADGKPLLTIRNQCVASKIVTDPSNGKVTHIEYFAYEEDGFFPTKCVAKGKIFSIAAHAVETAKLMLHSGVANSSDQLGRNLMDHPTMLTWGLMDEPVWPFRGPGSTNAIPTFRDGPFRSKMAPFVVPLDNWGWVWSQFSPGVPFAMLVGQGLFGRKLRQTIAHEFSRQVTFQWEFEQLGHPDNRVTLDPDFLDPLGIPRPIIHYKVHDYVRRSMKEAIKINKQICEKAGITDLTKYDPGDPGYVEYEGVGYSYKGCGHLVGTHRMGANPEDSVTDSWMRCWDNDNLYAVGCGSMPTFGTSNPTLTMVALAFRAAKSMIKDLS